MNLKFAVIIATCNRCESLKDTLDSLLKQNCNWDSILEIILVDNNSTDNTEELIKSYSSLLKTKLIYLKEKKQGKCYALNLAIKTTQADILAFTDDDVVLDTNWLTEILFFFKNNDVDVLGGRTLPLYPKKIPQWVKWNKHYLRGPIVAYDYGEGIIDYCSGKISSFIGANVVFRKSVFDKVGAFNTELGPGKGTFGDDTDMFFKAYKGNFKIIYDGKALVWHKVEKNRITLKYIAKWNYQSGKYTAIVEAGSKQGLPSVFRIPRYLWRGFVLKVIKLSLSVLFGRSFLENWCALFFNYGMMAGYRHFNRNIKSNSNL